MPPTLGTSLIARAFGGEAAPQRPGGDAWGRDNPLGLEGFSVVLAGTQEEVGVVEEVVGGGGGGGQALLRVVAYRPNPFAAKPPDPGTAGGGLAGPAGPPQAAATAKEVHFIPYVRDIVPQVDRKAGVLYVSPPQGLLELGRRQVLLEHLRAELGPLTVRPPGSGARMMPTRAALVEAGRADLARFVVKAGGFLEVAQALGLRSRRRPPGWWEDESNLDRELSLFVAAHWARFLDPDSGSDYWYNQITHRITWEEPELPEAVALDDEGSLLLTESEEDRVVPSRSAVLAAGRYDLHQAVQLHGGYAAVSGLLARRPAWPPAQHLRTLRALASELRRFVAGAGLPRRTMPPASLLLDTGRNDLYQAVLREGGFAAVAERLGWRTQRQRRDAWRDLDALLAELRSYLRSRGRYEDGTAPGDAAAEGSELEGQQEERTASRRRGKGAAAAGGALAMPTHAELAAAGRHDLRYALQRHGSRRVAELLGLSTDARGGRKRGGGGSGGGGGGGEPTEAQLQRDHLERLLG